MPGYGMLECSNARWCLVQTLPIRVYENVALMVLWWCCFFDLYYYIRTCSEKDGKLGQEILDH